MEISLVSDANFRASTKLQSTGNELHQQALQAINHGCSFGDVTFFFDD